MDHQSTGSQHNVFAASGCASGGNPYHRRSPEAFCDIRRIATRRIVFLRLYCFALPMNSTTAKSSLVGVSCCQPISRCLGSSVRFCPRPCSSTWRWARLATHRHRGPHSALPLLSCPLWPCNHRVCVIAKRLGFLRSLALAAGHGFFLGGPRPSAPTVHVSNHD